MKLENMEEYECDGGGGAKRYYLCDTADKAVCSGAVA